MNVRRRPADSCAASAASSEESTPPERKTPTGTSLTRWARTESRRRARSSSTSAPAGSRAQVLAAGGLRTSEALASYLSLLPDEQVPGRQLARSLEDRVGRGHEVEGEVGLERVQVDLAARQGAELRGEAKLAVFVPVVERLDAEAVARQDQPPLAPVPDRHGEHAAQARGEVESVLLVEVDDHLGVAVAREAVPLRLELGAQLAVVVDLAVLDDLQAPVLVRERLVAGVEVDDRESAARRYRRRP